MITKQTNNFSDLNFVEGEIILVDKPYSWTSFDVVKKIRNSLKVKKAGHAGTLDPMATGLLLVATGKQTKSLNDLQQLNKTYIGTILLGKTSDSMDMETELTEHPVPKNINPEIICKIRDEFLGETEQRTPMFSAAKVNGKRLYTLARKGEKIETSVRKIFIEKFEIKNTRIPELDFEITCSKGTYIRVIANDFGEKLGCGAVLKNLRRTKVGDYYVDEALTIEEFLKRISLNELLLS